MGKTTTNVVLRNDTIELLKPYMHFGQTYNGAIRELLDTMVKLKPETLKRLDDYRDNPNESVDDLVNAVINELENNIGGK